MRIGFSGALSLLALGLWGARTQADSRAGEEGDAPTKPATRYVVAAIGDSLTDRRVGGGRYLAEVARRCPGSRFDALGVGGQQTAHMRQRFDREIQQRHRRPEARVPYTHVLLLGGVNDLAYGPYTNRDTTRTRRHLTAMYERGRDLGLTVVAVTLPPWGRLRGSFDRRGEATRALNEWIVLQHGIGRIDFAVDIHPRLSCGDVDMLCKTYRRYADDLVHWNGAGHQLVGAALHEQVFSDCL